MRFSKQEVRPQNAEDDATFNKCMWRLIPFLVLLFVVNFLDRVNVGFAALTMNKDLGFSPSVYGFGAGVFFIGYCLFVLPSVLFLERVGARLAVSCMLAVWSLLSAGCAFVRNPESFYILRFLLGIAEAGFLPGTFFYMSLWFPEVRRGRAIALFMVAGPIANIAGGPLSALLLDLDNLAGLHGWQWLFLIEGLPAFLLSFVCAKVLSNGPAEASWLSPAEKHIIARSLAADPPAQHRDAWSALRDPRVTVLGLAYFGIVLSIYGFDFWLPQIVQAMGFSHLQIGLVTALIFALGAIAQVLSARSSDARGERTIHIVIPALLAAAGWMAAAGLGTSVLPVLFALIVVRMGVNATYGPFHTLPLSFLGGPAAAGGVALVTTVGAFGGFVGPFVMGALRQATGGYAAGMGVLAAGLVMTAAIVLGLGYSGALPAARLPLKLGASREAT
jgi:ACS family tartrate transporter-like MFS transporter